VREDFQRGILLRIDDGSSAKHSFPFRSTFELSVRALASCSQFRDNYRQPWATPLGSPRSLVKGGKPGEVVSEPGPIRRIWDYGCSRLMGRLFRHGLKPSEMLPAGEGIALTKARAVSRYPFTRQPF
jgi:hypothetical protein